RPSCHQYRVPHTIPTRRSSDLASTHDYILFFTNVGKVYRLKVHELPLGSRQSKGRAIQNLLPFRQGEQVRAVVQTRDFAEAEYLDRKSTRLNSSHLGISYAVFC